jgi:uncharacterized membrane protein YidH (DUF202 family)
MRLQLRTALALLATGAVIVGVFAVHWLIHSSKDPADTATVWSGDLGAAAIAVSLLTIIATWWTRGSSAVQAGTPAQVAAAAD